MSNTSSDLRSTQTIIRDLVAEWFLGNFDRKAIMRASTTSGSQYLLNIHEGRAENFRHLVGGVSVFYHARSAWVTHNGTHMPEATHIGYHVPTASMVVLVKERTGYRIVRRTSSISNLDQLSTVW